MEENRLNNGKIVLIGGSAGSLEVLLKVLPKLDSIESITIVIVLHRRNSDDNILEELLRIKTGLAVEEIEDKTLLLPGRIYVAPADYHLLFEVNSTFSLDFSEKVHYSRPSIDVAFSSASVVFGSQLTGILLSGANADGTSGLQDIGRNGGVVIVQSPETADVPYMPENALKEIEPDFVFSPLEIVEYVRSLVRNS